MYIYCITNKINLKKYIGCTVKEPMRRFNEHKWNYERGLKSALYSAFDKHGTENFTFKVIDVAGSLSELKELEILYIEYFNTYNENGYNMTKGGDGNNGCKHTEEFKKDVSERMKGNTYAKALKGTKRPPHVIEAVKKSLTGRKLSEEHRQKLSDAKKGKKLTKEHKRNIGEGNKGKTHTKENIEKLKRQKRCREVIQLTMTGRLVNVFFSISEASRQTGVGRTNIANCLTSTSGGYTAGGFVWNYKSRYSSEQLSQLIRESVL